MDWQVRCVGHKITLRVEKSARKVKSLLDIGTDCSPLKSDSHLFSDRHEAMPEDGKLDRIKGNLFRCLISAILFLAVRTGHNLDYHIAIVIYLGLAARLYQYRGRLVKNN
jgi:hypothetical protein